MERTAVAQTDPRAPGLPQQPFHPAVGRHLQAAGAASHTVEVPAGLDHLDQELPRRRVLARVGLPHGEVGTQQLPALLQRRLQLRRNRDVVGPRVALRREVPAEHRRGERPKVRQPRFRLAVKTESTFADAGPLLFRTARENRAGAHQGRRGHQEAGRPDEADPLQAGIYVRVALRHRLRRHAQGNDAPRLPIAAPAYNRCGNRSRGSCSRRCRCLE